MFSPSGHGHGSAAVRVKLSSAWVRFGVAISGLVEKTSVSFDKCSYSDSSTLLHVINTSSNTNILFKKNMRFAATFVSE